MRCCTLCNEPFDDIELQFGDVVRIEGEFWHVECYAEYYGEVVDVA